MQCGSCTTRFVTRKKESLMRASERASEWVEENAVRVAGAAALPILVPGAHTTMCTALEAYMIYNVARIYGQSMSIRECAALIPALGTTIVVGKTASALAGEYLNWIPVAGWALKGAVGGATAFAIGTASVEYFENKYPEADAVNFQIVGVKDFIVQAFQQLWGR